MKLSFLENNLTNPFRRWPWDRIGPFFADCLHLPWVTHPFLVAQGWEFSAHLWENLYNCHPAVYWASLSFFDLASCRYSRTHAARGLIPEWLAEGSLEFHKSFMELKPIIWFCWFLAIRVLISRGIDTVISQILLKIPTIGSSAWGLCGCLCSGLIVTMVWSRPCMSLPAAWASCTHWLMKGIWGFGSWAEASA